MIAAPACLECGVRGASGAPRITAALREALESATRSAARRGDVVIEVGRRGDPDSRIVRLAGQPEIVPRTPGDRSLAEIPVSELAAFAAAIRAARGDLDRGALKREVARELGVTRYTSTVDQLLERLVVR